MNYQLFLYIQMNVVFFVFVALIIVLYKFPPSVSDSFYKMLKHGWVFTIVTWLYAFPAMMLGVEISPLGFVAGVGLLAVSAAPNFKDKGLQAVIHKYGAYVSVIASQALILISGYWLINVAFLTVSAFSFLPPVASRKILIIEIVAFSAMSVFYWLYYFA